MAFGLENTSSFYRPELTDCAVNRMHHYVGGGVNWPNAGFEGAGKKRIKAAIGFGLAFGRLAHINMILLDKPLDCGGGQRAGFGGGKFPD